MINSLTSLAHNVVCNARLKTGGTIVFTAMTNPAITVPNASTGQGSANGLATLSTTGGTSLYIGASGWLNANGTSNIQSFSWRVPTTSPTTPAGGSRPIDIRFNQFTITGSCAICGLLLVPSSNGFNLGGVFPATGTAYNCGIPNGATISAGTLYGEAAITFAVPATDRTGYVSFESISGGAYTITLDTGPGYINLSSSYLY